MPILLKQRLSPLDEIKRKVGKTSKMDEANLQLLNLILDLFSFAVV